MTTDAPENSIAALLRKLEEAEARERANGAASALSDFSNREVIAACGLALTLQRIGTAKMGELLLNISGASITHAPAQEAPQA